jgi:hypothetical protein
VSAGNKTVAPCSALQRSQSGFSPLSAETTYTAPTGDIKRSFRCRNATGDQASLAQIKSQKHFVCAEEFILERNRSNDISVTNDTSNLNRLRPMSELFVFPLVVRRACIAESASPESAYMSPINLHTDL